MQYLGTIDKAKDIINKDFVEKLLGDYQPLINESSKLPYSLISGVPTSLPASDVYPWAKASTKPSYSYSEITGAISTTELQNYLTQNSYLNVTSGDNRYLQLSGGTINSSFGGLEIKRNYTYASAVKYSNTSGVLGYIGFNDNFNPMLWDKSKGELGVILHSGNYSQYALPLSGGEISGTLTISPTNISGFQSGLILKDNGYGGNEALKIVWTSTNYTNENWLAANPSTSELLFNNYYVWHSGNFTPSNYLPLSGGTVSGILTMQKRIVMDKGSAIQFKNDDAYTTQRLMLPYSGMNYEFAVFDGTNWGKIWHSSNDGSGSGLDADLLDGVQESGFCRHLDGVPITSHRGIGYGYEGQGWIGNGPALSVGYSGDNYLMQLQAPGDYTALHFRNRMNGTWGDWKTIAFTDSNVASATKLQTARTIWGQSFDGTGNVDGIIKMTSADQINGTLGLSLNYDCGTKVGTNIWDGQGGITIRCTPSGNVGIGTATPSCKLDVNGSLKITDYIDVREPNTKNRVTAYVYSGIGRLYSYNDDIGYNDLYVGQNSTNAIVVKANGNVGIGTANPSAKLEVNGILRVQRYGDSNSYIDIQSNDISVNYKGYDKSDGYCYHAFYSNDTELVRFSGVDNIATFQGNIVARGGITMYSMRALKNVVDERGLSLSELSTIKPTRYTWKDGRDNRLHFGGIADDIQQVLPEVVYSTREGILTMDYGNAAFAVASSLIKPVVDHEKRIAILEAENKELRNEIERLKSA